MYLVVDSMYITLYRKSCLVHKPQRNSLSMQREMFIEALFIRTELEINVLQ